MKNKEKDLEKESKRSIESIEKSISKKWERARNFNSERQEAYRELMAFYQGSQRELSSYNSKKPWVIDMNTPYASVAVDNRVASLLSEDYVGEIIPLGREDVEVTDKLRVLYEKEWKRLKLDNFIREAIRNSAIVRESYLHFRVDRKAVDKKSKKLGDIKVESLQPSKVYIDPSARNIRDAEFMFVPERITYERACEHYPEIKDKINSSGDSYTPDDRGEVYLDNDYTSQQDNIITKMHFYERGKGGNIYKTVLINGYVVEEPRDMKVKNFPIVQLRWKKAADSCYGLSLYDEVLTLQKALLSMESAITNSAIAYAAPSMLVSKESGIDPKVAAKAVGAPGVVFAVNGSLDNAMKPVIAPKVDASSVQIKNDFETKIDKITGNTSQFLGNLGSAGNTAGGSKMAVDRAKIIEYAVLGNIEEFIEDVTTVLIEYLVLLHSGQKVSYLDDRTSVGTYNFTEVEVPKKEEFDKLDYRFYIELSTKTLYSKERQKELLLELYTLERQYDTPVKSVTVTDIIRNTDLVNKDEIISRFNDLNKQDAETKAQAIMEIQQTAEQFGVDAELTSAAITEIISGVQETPALDQLLQLAEQAMQQQIAEQEQQMSQLADLTMATPEVQGQIEAKMQNSGLSQQIPQEAMI